MILLLIDENYGYRDWYAFYDDEEAYQKMYDNFQLLKPDLNCLVEVTSVFPEAIEGNPTEEVLEKHCRNIAYDYRQSLTIRYAHQHEADDSFMDAPNDDFVTYLFHKLLDNQLGEAAG